MDRDAAQVVADFMDDILNGRRPDAPERLIDNDALVQRVTSFRAAFPDLQVTLHTIARDGELVAVHLVGRGTHLGLFQGIPPTGRPWSASCTAVYRVQAGRIVDFWINWDELSILEQIGGVARLAPASA